jgi:uncharacterized protein YkwD
MDVLSRTLAVLALACAVAVGTIGSTAMDAGAAAVAGDCSPGADWGTTRADFAAQTVDLVNAHRAALGLRQLAVGSALQASAVWKARHMAKYGYMAHDDPAPPVARSTGERMAACGVTGGWGENIAAGYPTPASVVNGWLNSPGHRANIENPSYVSMGSGAASSASGQLYWAHTFSSSGSGAPPPPAPAPVPPPPAPAPAPAPVPAPPPSNPKPPAQPSPPATQPVPKAASAANPLSFRQLRLTPRRPSAGHVLGSSVIVLKRGARLKTGHVFCSARFHGRALKVLTRRLRAGAAVCAWRVPLNARGELVSATMIVQQGRLRAQAPFRARIS